MAASGRCQGKQTLLWVSCQPSCSVMKSTACFSSPMKSMSYGLSAFSARPRLPSYIASYKCKLKHVICICQPQLHDSSLQGRKRASSWGPYDHHYIIKGWLRQPLIILNHAQNTQTKGLKHLTTVVASLSSNKHKGHSKGKAFQCGDNKVITWWEEKMEHCKKPLTKELIKRLVYTNLMGLDESLRNGSLKEGCLNLELLDIKRKFPQEVLLCRVGEFYEAVGFDACILVEYAGLNPMCGTRTDVVPRAGCPIMNLHLTLNQLTQAGFSVCVYEEVKGPSQARQRKDRFVSGHAHPGSPYVYGLAGADIDLEFPDPVPVIGISQSARGYCFVSVIEIMRTFSVEDSLTEEAVVAKLRARPYHCLFLHQSLRNDPSGLVRWGEYGEGGLLWGECRNKNCEWFDRDPVLELLSKVRKLYNIDPEEKFREIVVPSEGRPRPLYVGTATQIGILRTLGVPSLIKAILPAEYSTLCIAYMRDLLLNPPPYSTAISIQAACRLISNIHCAVPDFTILSAGKLVKLISEREANYIEFNRVKDMAKDIISMHNDPELRSVLQHLLQPAWLATGLQFELEQLVGSCHHLIVSLNRVLHTDGDLEQAVNKFPCIPDDFFINMENSWKGHIKRDLAESFFTAVDEAARLLSEAVQSDFVPIMLGVKAADGPIGGSLKVDICFAREHQAVWFKWRRFTSVVKGSPVEDKVKQLQFALDNKGRKVGDDWYSTRKVEEALTNYRDATEKASLKVVESLKSLADELKMQLNVIVFISVLAVVAKTLFGHVREARRRKWCFPNIALEPSPIEGSETPENGNLDGRTLSEKAKGGSELLMVDLIPYWLDCSQDPVVKNTVQEKSLVLLTGPNGGGKSSLLRAVAAAALLSICGLMVPAAYAVVPFFDSLMLRMVSQDSPADGKSSFQMEMSELRTLLSEVTKKSLVLIDELCRGTEVQKGTFIVASVIEALDSVGCIGMLSTHLLDLLDMKLNVKGLVHKAMGTTRINGQLVPSWKFVDGECRESLAFETARAEGVPECVLQRAEHMYLRWKELHGNAKQNSGMRKLDNSEISSNAIPSTEDEPNLGYSNEFLNMQNASRVMSTPALYPFMQHMEQMALSGSSSCLCSNHTSSELNSNARPFSRNEESRNEVVRQGTSQLKDIEHLFSAVCENKLKEIMGICGQLQTFKVKGTLVHARERPPPAATNRSCVYMFQRPDGKYYVGQTDNLEGRIAAHRSSSELKQAPFIYVMVENKSVACALETVLINQLPVFGLDLVNLTDQHHRHFGTGPFQKHNNVPF